MVWQNDIEKDDRLLPVLDVGVGITDGLANHSYLYLNHAAMPVVVCHHISKELISEQLFCFRLLNSCLHK